MHNIVWLGSDALRHHGIEVDRPKLDLDLACEAKSFVAYLKAFGWDKRLIAIDPSPDAKKLFAKTVLTADGDKKKLFVLECEIAWPDSLIAEFIQMVIKDPESDFTIEKYNEGTFMTYFPSLNALYMLKMTHRYLKNSPHFKKTMADILLMRSKGATITKYWKKWYKKREKETYDYGHPKLNVTKKEFFSDDNITYVYDHDSIHEAVKHLDCPAYDKFKPDTTEVLTSMDLFFKMPRTWQLLATLEESYVLSLERAIVPFNITDELGRKQAFDTALMKVCTSITSGRFREFSWENYHAVQAMYDQEYVERFWTAVTDGRVTPYVKA